MRQDKEPSNKLDKQSPNQVDDSHSQEDNENFYGTVKRYSKKVFMPYMFSHKDANPFRDTSQPLNLLKRYVGKSDGKKFSEIDEVLYDNPEFEAVRGYALRKLKRRRLVVSVILLCWMSYYFFIGDFNAFPVSWMNTALSTMYSVFLPLFILVTDIQYLVFKRRLLKLSIFGWIGIRFGSK
jgi:hypothetical protein